jgi:hypothetical protein
VSVAIVKSEKSKDQSFQTSNWQLPVHMESPLPRAQSRTRRIRGLDLRVIGVIYQNMKASTALLESIGGVAVTLGLPTVLSLVCGLAPGSTPGQCSFFASTYPSLASSHNQDDIKTINDNRSDNRSVTSGGADDSDREVGTQVCRNPM